MSEASGEVAEQTETVHVRDESEYKYKKEANKNGHILQQALATLVPLD